MRRLSAGIVTFRSRNDTIEVFLVHPGGPFWRKKDAGAWSIPKGEYLDGEDALAAAIREFEEETGFQPTGPMAPLGAIRQPGGKVVTAWALEGDLDPGKLRSNQFSIEWPKGSGKMREFPEIDRGGWFSLEVARTKILKGQIGFLDRVCQLFPPQPVPRV